MRKDERANQTMPSEGTKKESHKPVKQKFGFIVEQAVNKWTSRAEIEKSINNFFDYMRGPLSEKCHIKAASIQTDTHYDGRRKVLQGLCFVPKETSENVIDSLFYQGKAVWRSQPTEPYDFFLV